MDQLQIREYSRRVIIERLTALGLKNAHGKKYESGSIDRICKKLHIVGEKRPYTYYDKKTGKETKNLEWVYSREDAIKILDYCKTIQGNRTEKPIEKEKAQKKRINSKEKLLAKIEKLTNKNEQLKGENKQLRKELAQENDFRSGFYMTLSKFLEELYNRYNLNEKNIEEIKEEQKRAIEREVIFLQRLDESVRAINTREKKKRWFF